MNPSPDPQKGSDPESQWAPCPPGILRKAILSSQARRRRNFLALIAGGTVMGAIGGGATIGVLLSKYESGSNKPGGNPLGGMACISVYNKLPEYLTGDLDDKLAEQITSHLMDCLKCRQAYKKMCPNRSSSKNSEHKSD